VSTPADRALSARICEDRRWSVTNIEAKLRTSGDIALRSAMRPASTSYMSLIAALFTNASALFEPKVGIRGDTTFDSGPLEHSDQIHVAERMRLVGPDTLEDQITVTDPKALAKPWVVNRRYKRAAKGFEIREYVCNENNRPVFQSPGAAGGG
jgi:hypothetical protein